MKTNKWLRIILTSLLTLIVLAGVGAAGYRLGVTQNPAVVQQWADLRAQRFNQLQERPSKAAIPQQDDNQTADALQAPGNQVVNPHMQGFDPRGQDMRGFDSRTRFDRNIGDRRDGFASPFFGLLHLIILAALVWLGYKYVKNSGWKLVREVSPAPVAASVPENKE